MRMICFVYICLLWVWCGYWCSTASALWRVPIINYIGNYFHDMRHYVAPLIYHWVQSLAAMREVIMDSLQRATNTILYKIPYQHNIVHSWYSTESKWPGLAPVILCADFAPSLCGWCAWHSYDNYATYRSPQRAQCVSSCAVLIVYVFLVVRNLAKKYTFKLYHIHESVRTPYRRSKRSF